MRLKNLNDLLTELIDEVKTTKERAKLLIYTYEAISREQVEKTILEECKISNRKMSKYAFEEEVDSRVKMRMEVFKKMCTILNNGTTEQQASLVMLMEVLRPGSMTTIRNVERNVKYTTTKITRKQLFEEYYPDVDSNDLYNKICSQLKKD